MQADCDRLALQRDDLIVQARWIVSAEIRYNKGGDAFRSTPSRTGMLHGKLKGCASYTIKASAA
jgi:hypothetical protein